MKKIRQKIISPFQTILSEGVVKISLCCFLLMFLGMQGTFAQVYTCADGSANCADDFDPGNPGACTPPPPGEDCVGNAFACGVILNDPPASPAITDSSCPDGITLIPGSFDFSGLCPTGVDLEFSTDGGMTWSGTAPAYDQENPITFEIRCTCNEGLPVSTPSTPVTTAPVPCAPPACIADAPTMSIDCTDCGDGTFGGPCTVTDAGDGSANTGEITEYIVIDDAAGTATGTADGIISVGALADAQAAVDALADGDEVCVTAITHVQTELDAVIAAIEATLAGLGASLGLPATGNDLAAVFGAIQVLGGGATVDLATIEAIIAGGAGGQVDLGAVIGAPPGLVVVDIPPFCYNVDPAVCVTASSCPPPACDIAVAISNVVCDAGADPDNPVDDMITFDYTVTGSGATWSSDQGDAGVAYNTTITVGPVPADGSTWTVNVTDDADGTCTSSTDITLTDCGVPTDIPTLSEWGLITLALLLMTFGSVKMAVGSVALASTGSRNIPVPGTNNFQLPFDAAVFRKATTFTGILAIIGFAVCFAIFGAIFLPDVIGVLIAGPVFAYLAHLLYILETRKEN